MRLIPIKPYCEEIDMLSDSTPGAMLSKYVHRSTFKHKGIDVEERVCPWDEPGQYKVLWARAPIEYTVMEGVVNPVVSADFVLEDYHAGTDVEQEARAKVMKQFDEYWFKENGDLAQRNSEQYQEWKKSHASA